MAYLPVLPRSVLVHRNWKRGLAAGLIAGGAFALAFWQKPAQPAEAAPRPIPTMMVGLPAPTLAAAVVQPRRHGPEAFELDMAPVLSDGGLRVVLRDRVESSWLAGSPKMTDDEGVTVVTRPLSAKGRAEVGLATGARLRLYRADGSSCLARVSGLVAVARLDVGDALDPDGGATSAWEAAGESRVLAGDLEPIEGRCAEALWARSESLPAPRLAEKSAASAGVRRTAERALRMRPEYRELTDGTGDEQIDVSTLSDGTETLVVTTFVAEGCTGPSPALVGLWRLAGDRLVFLGAEEMVSDILTGTDADGDGRMELLASEDMLGVAVLRRATGQFIVEQQASVPILGCRC
jgi:hypothetical protein